MATSAIALSEEVLRNAHQLRSNIFFGQRLRYNIPNSKRIMHQAISLYYEISTCDIYLISKITNKSYPWSKTLSLAIGIKWDM